MPGQGDDDRTRSESREERGHPSEELTNLALAALAGSSDDLERFLKACWQYAYDAARRLHRQHHGAEDGAQEAATAAWELLKGNALRPETVDGFIGTVVLRSAYAAAKRRAREADAAARMAPAREAPDPARDVETIEWARAVRDVVEALPPLLRRLINLCYGDDMSTRGIAREVGMAKTSIIRLLAEAETLLRNELRQLADRNDDRGDGPRC